MTEYRVRLLSDKHYCQVNGVDMADSKGNDLLEFPIKISNKMADILDIIGYSGGITLTFSLNSAGVMLVINEETGLNYFVDYGVLHNSHTFPTDPPVEITYVDV